MTRGQNCVLETVSRAVLNVRFFGTREYTTPLLRMYQVVRTHIYSGLACWHAHVLEIIFVLCHVLFGRSVPYVHLWAYPTLTSLRTCSSWPVRSHVLKGSREIGDDRKGPSIWTQRRAADDRRRRHACKTFHMINGPGSRRPATVVYGASRMQGRCRSARPSCVCVPGGRSFNLPKCKPWSIWWSGRRCVRYIDRSAYIWP
jgi:hypothetical protein